MNILLIISYVGTGFCGFQIQKNKRTVQGELENALQELYGEKVRVVGSGRTDEGVHALAQAVNFIAPKNIPLANVARGLNCFLPNSIRVKNASEVDDNFNARINAIKKTYIYKFYLGSDDPFLQDRAMRLDSNINVSAMADAAKLFVGEHNFNAFRCYGSSAKTTTRAVYECGLTFFKAQEPSVLGEGESRDTLILKICANGFLYKMVRLIVGALVKVGSGKLEPQEIKNLLESGAFYPSKIPAPSCGLYLLKVDYNQN